MKRTFNILLAEDDADDRLLAKEALEETRISGSLHCVEDGEELLDYLRCRGRYSARARAPRPDIILLDLNMPRKDGREALREIKADPELRRIPVIALTTSKEKEDVRKTYDLGASSYIKKPSSFDGLVDVMRTLGKYWSEMVELPAE
jgi:CheY-like chemotaxis protein